MAKDVTFFFLKPYEKSRVESNAVIVENRDGIVRKMTADAANPGWERFSWDADSLPDSVLIYRETDTEFVNPIGYFGYRANSLYSFPMKFLPNPTYFVSDTAFLIMEDRLSDGIFSEDVRRYYYFDWLRENGQTLFVLIPDYPEWIDEVPQIVDADFPENSWEMSPDAEYPGWFLYKWEGGEYVPLSFLLYRASDSLRENPIGRNGFAYGETEVVPETLLGDSTFFYPDLNYNCEIPNSVKHCAGSCWYSGRTRPYDVRSQCPMRYDSRQDSFEPRYFTGISPVRRASFGWEIRVFAKGVRIVGGAGLPVDVFNAKGQRIYRGASGGSLEIPLPAPGSYLVKVGGEARRVICR